MFCIRVQFETKTDPPEWMWLKEAGELVEGPLDQITHLASNRAYVQEWVNDRLAPEDEAKILQVEIYGLTRVAEIPSENIT